MPNDVGQTGSARGCPSSLPGRFRASRLWLKSLVVWRCGDSRSVQPIASCDGASSAGAWRSFAVICLGEVVDLAARVGLSVRIGSNVRHVQVYAHPIIGSEGGCGPPPRRPDRRFRRQIGRANEAVYR